MTGTVHIYSFATFTEESINFFNSHFKPKEHIFYVAKNKKKSDHLQGKNIKMINIKTLYSLLRDMHTSDKIIVHNLTVTSVIILYLHPWLLKKTFWAIWGGDLYYYLTRSKNLKTTVHEHLRKFVIKNIKGLITHVEGDYVLAQKWYGATGGYYYSFLYPSNLFKENELTLVNNYSNNITNILVGNSADPSNNHREILEKLYQYKNNVKIICPLSYGDKEYAQEIIKLGVKLFEDRFIPLTNFLKSDEYTALLSEIDVAIFNHDRQQAVGNITTLLGLGKKVYIRDNITTWQFCLDHNLSVYSIQKQFNELFDTINPEIEENNIRNIRTQFTVEKLIYDWKNIFKEEIV